MCLYSLQGQASPSDIMAKVVRDIQPERKTGTGWGTCTSTGHEISLLLQIREEVTHCCPS